MIIILLTSNTTITISLRRNIVVYFINNKHKNIGAQVTSKRKIHPGNFSPARLCKVSFLLVDGVAEWDLLL